MTQNLLFAELEWSAANLRAWAEAAVVETPTVSIYEHATESREGGYVDAPTTVEYVLRGVMEQIYMAGLDGLDTFDLKEEIIGYCMNGVGGKLPCDMNVDELLASIMDETRGGWDFGTMEEFLDSGLSGNWGEPDED